jgi:cytidylate kinase
MIIAIDGPTASGKGTIARAVGAHMGLPVMDTGLLYRLAAAAALARGVDLADADAVAALAADADEAAFAADHLRGATVGQGASIVAAHPQVRRALLERQRAFARQPGGAVLDGRDIATVICPDADLKLYVDASVTERARRRHAELASRGEVVPLPEMEAQIAARDARDMGRADAPLRRVPDAILLDTTDLSIDAAIARACRLAEDVRARLGQRR